MNNKIFEENLKRLDVSWDAAPKFEELKKIKERIIIGPNGCGKSRLLRALDETLFANGVMNTDVLYADFPQMASTERKGTDESSLQLLKNIFIDRRNTPIYDTLKLISNDPVEGIKSLTSLAKSDFHCKSAVSKVNSFLKSLFSDSFEMENIITILTGEKELSPGQRSIFYMSVMLGVLAEYHADDVFYILLDEPDQHLHAKSIIDFIVQLQENLPKAKIWIATHSIHLMAHYKFDEIIYIKDGKVQPNNSSMYDEICETMVDTKEMQQFVSYTGLYGFYEFFRGCLSEVPAESETNNKLDKIKQNIQQRGLKKVLDYGAGKGRFFKLLSDIDGLDYHAFEINRKYHKILSQILPSEKIYTATEDIPEEFDAVLLINTLHEIPLDEWPRTFVAIKKLLKPNGCMLFCETSPLITGEYIESPGFLVLGINEQQKLFGVESIYLDERQKLHFSNVPYNNIPILNEQNLKDTLASLKDNSFSQWEREKNNARNLAFYAVQHMNAERAIEELPDTLKRVSMFLKFDEEIKENPNNPTNYINRGDKFYNLDKFELALGDYSKAIELDPDKAEYYNNRAYPYYSLRDYECSLADDNKAIELNPNNSVYYSDRGDTYVALKKYELAIDDYSKAIEIDKNKAYFYNKRADAYSALGREEEAAADRQEANRLKEKW